MTVSIFMATRDRPEFLPRAINSVLHQTDPDWELVILDNGTRQESLVPKDPRIRYFYRSATGPADAFQQALDQTTGEVVMPMGDDDELADFAVASIRKAMEDSPALWGYGQTAFKRDGQTQFLLGAQPWSLEALRQDYNLGGAVFWRRELTQRLGGFDSDYDGAADYDLYLRFGEDSEPVQVPEVLYLYNDHPGTDTNARSERQRAAAHRIRTRARGDRPKVAVITPWKGHLELVPYYAQTVERADQVIIVDNGGGPSAEALGPVPVTIVTPDEPLGFAASNNLGLAHVDDGIDIVVFLNNDVHANPAWLEQVRDDVEDGALYGPAIGRQTLAGTVLPYVEGWCIAATWETWRSLGEPLREPNLACEPWDEVNFPLAYWEDVELSLRASHQGLELRRAPWQIRHLGGLTTRETPGIAEAFAHGQKVLTEQLQEMLAWHL